MVVLREGIKMTCVEKRSNCIVKGSLDHSRRAIVNIYGGGSICLIINIEDDKSLQIRYSHKLHIQ